MQYLMLVSAAILLSLDFAVNKYYQSFAGTGAKAAFLFNSLLGAFTALIFFAFNGFKLSFTPYSFAMASLMSLAVMCYNVIGFKILRSGSMATYTLFLMSGGMMVPYIFGIFFLDEPFSVLRTVALLFILTGIFVSAPAGKRINTKILLMCISVFFINGLTSIISKLHQTEAVYGAVNSCEFVILGAIFKCIISAVLFLLMNKKSPSGKTGVPLLYIGTSLASALFGGLAFLLQLIGASNIPATLLYPFITGGTIVFSSVTGILLFKEKVSKRTIFSVTLCFCGTLLFL